jgi:hypothetical protein
MSSIAPRMSIAALCALALACQRADPAPGAGPIRRSAEALLSGALPDPGRQLEPASAARMSAVLHRQRFVSQNVLGGEPAPPDAFERAMQQWRQLPRVVPGAGSVRTAAVSTLRGQTWLPLGLGAIRDTNNNVVNGRVNAIAVNPNNPNVVYQGAAGGGVWRSTNAADPKNPATWTPLFDQEPSLGIGEPAAVAIDPSNTDALYVGTSTERPPGRPAQLKNVSRGILKSTDAGGSWVVLGAECASACGTAACNRTALCLFGSPPGDSDVNALIVDPTTPSTLYAATGAGLFRSTDGGQSWTMGVGGGGVGESLVLDPTSPTASRILYAGVNGVGIVQSTNGGASWTSILTAATPAVATALASVVPNGTGVGRVMIALAPPASPANPAGIQVLYATIEGTGGFFATNLSVPLGIFETTNQGATFTQRPANNLGSGFGFFAVVIGVDPASPGDGANDILYWGGVNYRRSTDSGANFTSIDAIHEDAHALAFATSPATGNTIVFVGNDGGIWRSDDNGADWTGTPQANSPPTLNGGGLQTTLYYHMDVQRDTAATTTLGAMQDNGIIKSCPTCAAPVGWTIQRRGDGIDVAFDVQATANAYAVDNIDVFASTDSGTTYSRIGSTQGIPAAELAPFANQVNVDPNNAGFIYVSGAVQRLFQNRNAGAFRDVSGMTFPGPPGEVDVAPANSNDVLVAQGGSVFLSTNALAATPAFTNITTVPAPGLSLPGRVVNQVAFDPSDPTVVYVVLGGFNSPGATGHLFRRKTSAATWTDLSPALDVPFLSLAVDGTATPSALYVGTAVGVIRSVDGGASWAVLDDVHFPNVPVTELKINSTARVLRAATFGRGAFDFAPSSGPVISVNAANGLSFGAVCSGGTATLTLQVFNVGTTTLVIDSVRNLFSSPGFTVLPNPATPVAVAPGAEVDFTVQFTPTGAAGTESATIRVASNDPNAPFFDLVATGSSGTAAIATLIANSGSFGNVCIGSFADLPLTVNNNGTCPLTISGITSSSSEFKTAGVATFPLQIEAGGSLQVPIRFEPGIFGARSATIAVASSDPAHGSVTVAVSGNAPRPRETNTSCKFVAINAGGPTVTPFLSDRSVSGGSSSTSSSVSTAGVIVPAPAKVYQTLRFGTFTYTIKSFTAGSKHGVRLHFAENRFNAANQRLFNVIINGVQVLTSFDVFQAAGGKLKAVVPEFATTADSSGTITIKFVTVKDHALVDGIEIE